jgi:ABC-2 type transport system permease protein
MAEVSKLQLTFETQSKPLLVLRDCLIMVKRSSLHIIRNRDQLLGTFFQPIMFLILFATVFGGAVNKSLPPGVSYLDFLLAGIIIQTVAFGSTTTAVAVCNDLQKGIMDRFRSLPMSNLAVLTGHVVSDLFRNALSTLVMIVTGLLIGFRSHASVVDWLMIAGLIALFTLAFSWLAAIVGVVAKSVEGVQWLTFVLVFPLTFASSAFVPTEGMNSVLKAFAVNQPITQVINAVRALMLGEPLGNHLVMAVVWCVGILAVSIPLASFLFRKRANQ